MELAKIFGSGMILQAEKPILFFGTGKGIIKIFLTEKFTKKR